MRVAAGVGGRERRARPVVERMAAREWRGWPGGVFRHSGGARWLVVVRSAAVWGRHGWRPPVCSAEARRVRRAGESSKRLKALQPRAAFAALMLLPESSAGHRAGRHGPVDAQYLTGAANEKTSAFVSSPARNGPNSHFVLFRAILAGFKILLGLS